MLISFALSLALHTWASDDLNGFYRVKEQTFRYQAQQTSKKNMNAPEELFVLVKQVFRQGLSLLNLQFYQQKFPDPSEPYKRVQHFGGWVRDRRDNSCLDTRARVLVRDSVTAVSMRANNRCVVDRGQWNDLYTAQPYVSADQIQIDHVVALKNAYMSGAHQWSYADRCLYANYFWNKDHLLAVEARENMRKGDRSPADWLPPARQNACGHIARWLEIKLLWQLVLSQREAQAITNQVKALGCDLRQFVMDAQEFVEQRRQMQVHRVLCGGLPPGFGSFEGTRP